MLDSSVLIQAERGRLDLREILTRHERDAIVIAAITASELLHGVHRARTEEQRRDREAFVEAVLETMPIVDFDLPAARRHAAIWAELATAGRMVSPHDLIIAACALAHGFRVATCDLRHFERIPGLAVLDWCPDREA